ncbi:MAG TPA: FtsX-like permease family protein [Streptosporangiaceae bacterium]|jgi:putative ABC transport system permease protein
MWRLTAKGVVAHRLRYGLTALAVLLGVAFIAGTLVFTDTINATFNGLESQIYHGTAAVIRARQPFNPGTNFTSQRERIDASLAGPVRQVPGVQAVSLGITGYAQLVGRNGKPVGTAANGPPTLGVAWTSVPALNPLRILPGGHPPRTASQVVIDKHSADVGHFRVGDRVEVLTQRAPGRYTITGIATWGSADSPLGASITAFTPATAARVVGQPGKVDAINVQAAPGVTQSQLVSRLRAAIHDPKIEVVSGRTVTVEGQDTIHQALGFINVFLLVFAFIALFVGSFVIFNTFSIVVAQRMRELALLRAVGASRGQVMASVLGEALVIGVLASAVGLVAGIGLAVVLKAGLAALGFGIPASGLVVGARTVLTGLAVGTLITLVAAFAPARRASRIPPVAALQDAAAEPRQLSAWRAARGGLLTAAGAAVLSWGLFAQTGNRVAAVGGGAVAVFVGVAMLGPFAARPVSRLLGAPLAARGATGKLARQNAMRNPARTSATAAALMVGVTLVSLMTIIASSTKASVNGIINSAMRADYTVSSGGIAGGASGFSPVLERSLSALPQVSSVAGIRSAVVQLYGKATPVVATDPVKASQMFSIGVTQGRLARMTSSGIAVSTQIATARHLRIGSPVTVTFPTTGRKTFTVQAIYRVRELAGDYVLPVAAAQANFPQALDIEEFVKLAPGVSMAAGRHAIDNVLAAYPNATLMNETQYKAQQAQQVSQLLNLVYGLLALAVIIALIGIANTLALSIYERTRELGLLRAVGMTRGQLRSVVRQESLVISLFGTVEGLVLGMLLGWAIVTAMHAQGITQLVFPVVPLLILAVAAGLAGLVAAIAPSRRAARLDVLRAVTTQ